MEEITEFFKLYVEDSDMLEEEAAKISRDLEQNIKDVIRPGQVGYDTGHLHDSVESNFEMVSNTVATVIGWYGADYGQYWYRWVDGVDFLEVGLEKTLEAYK